MLIHVKVWLLFISKHYSSKCPYWISCFASISSYCVPSTAICLRISLFLIFCNCHTPKNLFRISIYSIQSFLVFLCYPSSFYSIGYFSSLYFIHSAIVCYLSNLWFFLFELFYVWSFCCRFHLSKTLRQGMYTRKPPLFPHYFSTICLSNFVFQMVST